MTRKRDSRGRYTKNPRGGRFDRCVRKVTRSRSVRNPYAVCAPTLKPRRRRNPRPRTLTIPEQHQLRIARQTLRMSDAMAGVMGGPTKAEAREIIRRLTGQRARNPRKRRSTVRKSNVTRRGPRGELFSLIARKGTAAPMVYTGDKFARSGRPVLFSTLAAAKATARIMQDNYPALRSYSIWAREV